MAAVVGQPDRPLTERLRREPAGFNYFQLVSLLARGLAPDALGRALRFKGALGAGFPAAEVNEVRERPDGTLEVASPNYAIGGVLGPLPETYTEWLRERARDGDHAMAAFLDLFNNRVHVLRFGLKAARHPVLAGRGPEDAPHIEELAALAGFAGAGLPLPRAARPLLAFAGLLANRRRSAPVLARMLAWLFRMPVAIEQFVGEWLTRADDELTALGRRNSRLGAGCVLGRRVWHPAAAIRVVTGPLGFARFRALLPGGAEHGALVEFLRFLTDRELDFELRLLVDERTLPDPTLTAERNSAGALRLGHTAWLHDARRDGVRAVDCFAPAFARVAA